MNHARWRSRADSVLRASPVFGKLEGEAFDELIAHLSLVRINGGELVLREGDTSESIVILISGKLRVWRIGNDGSFMRYNEITPGESVGEAGMILRQPRTANVTALRDSLLGVLSREAYEHLLIKHPLSINRIAAQAIFNYLRHLDHQRQPKTGKSFAIIPLQAGDAATQVADALHAALAARGNTFVMRPPGVSVHSADTPSALPPEDDLEHLDALERDNEFLLFANAHRLSPWLIKSVHQSDQIIYVADARQPVRPPDALENELAAAPGFALKRKHLVLLHAADAPHAIVHDAWHSGRDLERIYPLRRDCADDFARLARFLTDSAIGLVLGGGGARGFAHIGVLKALEQSDWPIDLIGGNSMGALIGAQYACGLTPAEICVQTRRFALGGEYPTLPLVSLLSGKRMERDLRKIFGDIEIETLWRSFFAAACNLSRADTIVQDRGALWRAVLASNSPAGLLPPVLHRGDLLVDGAILDNVPVAAMRTRLGTPLEKRRGNGTVIAVDVDIGDTLNVAPETPRLSALAVLKTRLGMGDARMPGIGDILYRAGHIASMQQRAHTNALTDRYLEPPVGHFPLMGYRQAEHIVEAGYRYAMEQIERWNSP